MKLGNQLLIHSIFVVRTYIVPGRNSIRRLVFQDAFSIFGEVKAVRIVTHISGKPKGVAYVEFVKEEDAVKAVQEPEIILLGKILQFSCRTPIKVSIFYSFQNANSKWRSRIRPGNQRKMSCLTARPSPQAHRSRTRRQTEDLIYQWSQG